MPTGEVKWFDPKKGFGFIKGPDGLDVFVHYTVIDGSGFRALKDGEMVTYDFTEGDKGLQAVRVTRLGGTARKSTPPPPSQPYTTKDAPPSISPQFDDGDNGDPGEPRDDKA